ncbi:hypothetical protein DPMN_156651 [Dreissena polymorpha]|uniref:Uncharacterized protein n=1 Tax=Dreissena polymorpha TaxID=45954 RepID=A0A9D4JC13_DREPO|nr:hypothetical protein DPMN_156651 [Dreissena polymorpha]
MSISSAVPFTPTPSCQCYNYMSVEPITPTGKIFVNDIKSKHNVTIYPISDTNFLRVNNVFECNRNVIQRTFNAICFVGNIIRIEYALVIIKLSIIIGCAI